MLLMDEQTNEKLLAPVVETELQPTPPAAKPPDWPRRLLKALRVGAKALGAIWLTSIVIVLGLRFLPPFTSAFMIARYLQAVVNPAEKPQLAYQWVRWDKIAPALKLAVIAGEDQTFPTHWGFDLASLTQAFEANKSGRRLRGASTISQQVAKNLFLWSGKSYVRKGLEAYFTVLLELLWSKKRILEVYVNIAEFGDQVYGAEAAAQTFWRKSAATLTTHESAMLASVLPNPKQRDLHQRPSVAIRTRARWIEGQMRNLGGESYLRQIDKRSHRD